MPLSLTLCGRVAVTGDATSPVARPLAAKSIALLAYLVLEPGPRSRDELAALLWGEYPEEKAKASLRQALMHLREALPGSIHVERASVELTGPVECDVLAFRRLARESPRAAAEYPVFAFLDGLQLRHCGAFDEWVDRMRASLTREANEVLSASTREALATRQWRDAVLLGERWVGVSPLSAAAVTSLMEAQLMNGEPGAALQTFADYRNRLSEETGQAPERAVMELAERIRSAPVTARRHATEEWYATAPSFEGSLVGRTAEWERLTHSWREVARGRGRVVLIEGDAGVGKTRLASDFLRWVTAEGGTILRGRAYDAPSGVPFGALIEALRSGIDAPGLAATDPRWLAEVARLVPELRERFPALPDPGAAAGADALRLFEGVAQMLAAIADEAPVAVLIDDVQWCDADGCTMLHFLIRKMERVAVLWCLTSSPGAVQRDAPAARLVRAVRTFRNSESVVLRPLHEEEVWQLVRDLGRVTAPTGARRLAARIHEVTTGYPFYVVELLKTLFAQGWLTVDPETGEWIVNAQDAAELGALTLAPSVHEAIAERIECLPDELRAVLISLAVSARGCRVDTLSFIHGMSRLRAAANCDALVERHLTVEEEGVYRCAHPVIARVVSDALGPSRRREVHRSLALALDAAQSSGTGLWDPGEIARHADQGGEQGIAYRYAMRAAADCEARFAYEEALAWIDLAAGAASSAEETDAVDRTTARLLEVSGWRELPRVGRETPQPGRLVVSDFDLPMKEAGTGE